MKPVIVLALVVGIIGVGISVYSFLGSFDGQTGQLDPSVQTGATTTESEHSVETLSSGEWRLKAVDGIPVVTSVEVPYDLAFSERRIAGSFCNVFSASMDASEDGKLMFGQVSSTKKMCTEEVMAVETPFMTLLREGATFTLAQGGQSLTLSGSASSSLFTFVRRPE